MARNPRIGCVVVDGHTYHLTDTGRMHILEMSALGCSVAEIAKYLRVSREWMVQRLDETSEFFDELAANAYNDGAGEFTKRLREGQARLAEVNAQMSIHLGKHYLDQKDVQHVEVSKKIQIVGTLPDYGQTAEDWARNFVPTPLQQPQPPRALDAVDAEFEEQK